MKFLVELRALIGARRTAWLRPILIVLLLVGALVLLAGGYLDVFFPRREADPQAPFTREHYRQDGAFLSR